MASVSAPPPLSLSVLVPVSALSAALDVSWDAANLSSREIGDLTADAISVVDGNCGKMPFISSSMRCLSPFKLDHASPTWRATRGNLSGPKMINPKTRTISNFVGVISSIHVIF
jgi:hypothetical protein